MISFLIMSLLVFQAAESKPVLRYTTSRPSTVSYSSRVVIAEPERDISFSENGILASYSNKTVSRVRGAFYEAGDSLSCTQSQLQRRRHSSNVSTPRVPFVALVELTSDCNHYHLALSAQDNLGASGVVFYSPVSRETLTKSSASNLKIVVAFIQMDSQVLRSYKDILDVANSTITVEVHKVTPSYRTSQTFYFVVFAFSILVLLSLAWFTVTYVRRCHSYCSRRHSRRRRRQATTRAITNLPTKKHKVAPKADTDSINSLDEPTCAVCLETFKHNEIIRPLPCSHEFHKKCIDPWLQSKSNCPLCKYNIIKRQHPNTSSVTISRQHSSTSDTVQLATSDSAQLAQAELQAMEDVMSELFSTPSNNSTDEAV